MYTSVVGLIAADGDFEGEAVDCVVSSVAHSQLAKQTAHVELSFADVEGASLRLGVVGNGVGIGVGIGVGSVFITFSVVGHEHVISQNSRHKEAISTDATESH